MSFRNCSTCGISFDELRNLGKDSSIWCDGGILEVNHGGGQCKACYSKKHNFCTNCKNKPLSKEWKYCPWCGKKAL